jgi:hypothetical protein
MATLIPHRGPLWWLSAFLCGAAAVLIVHQGALAALYLAGFTASAPYSLAPTQPWGVPQLWSLAFWGGVWGIVLAAALRRLTGGGLVVASLVFGAIVPTLVAWFIVAPLKGQPVAAGFIPAAMAIGPIVNAAWGFGTGVGLALFGRANRRRRAADRRGPPEPVAGERRQIPDRRLAAG